MGLQGEGYDLDEPANGIVLPGSHRLKEGKCLAAILCRCFRDGECDCLHGRIWEQIREQQQFSIRGRGALK